MYKSLLDVGIRHFERPRVVLLVMHGIDATTTTIFSPVLHQSLRIETGVVLHWSTVSALIWRRDVDGRRYGMVRRQVE